MTEYSWEGTPSVYKVIVDCKCNDNTTIEEYDSYEEAKHYFEIMNWIDHYQLQLTEDDVVIERARGWFG